MDAGGLEDPVKEISQEGYCKTSQPIKLHTRSPILNAERKHEATVPSSVGKKQVFAKLAFGNSVISFH